MNNTMIRADKLLAGLRYERTVLSALAMSVLCSCNVSEIGHSAYIPAEDFYSTLKLESRAINLAMQKPYDTVTLNVIRQLGDGRTVPGAVDYSVSNSAIAVSSDGVLTAIAPVTRAIVRASLTYGGITRTDSAIVSVVAGAPDLLQDFGMRLSEGDSAKFSVSGGGSSYKTIPLIRQGQSGRNVSTLLIDMGLSDTTKGRFVQSGNNLRLTPRRPGRLVLYVSTFAYGRSYHDSLNFTVGWSLVAYLNGFARFPMGQLKPILDFYPNTMTLGVGACVVFMNYHEDFDMDVVFEDPTSAEFPYNAISGCANSFWQRDSIGGNVAPFRKLATGDAVTDLFSQYKIRVFRRPGVYPYRSVLNGTSGSIRVCDETRDTTCAPVRGEWY